MDRYLLAQVRKDLARKMVFVAGPRQVGKTTLAKSLASADEEYLNWDIPRHRSRILENDLPATALWIFDEIHKWRRWRNFLKGLFDEHGKRRRILVTGSARLDYYRFGGDSLQGRYHLMRLHPLSVAELGIRSRQDLETLLTLGGFPEPFFGGSEVDAKRWSREYRSLLLRDELASLEHVLDINNLELLLIRLPELVGSPLSLNSLREDLEVSHESVKRWLGMIERVYGIFFLAPFGAPNLKAVKKERKHYHFDWSIVPNRPARFENMFASHLLKWVHAEQDLKGRDVELRYFRDQTGREVDFVITENNRPIQAVECKLAETSIAQPLRYLKSKYKSLDAYQVVLECDRRFVSAEGITVIPAAEFLGTLC